MSWLQIGKKLSKKEEKVFREKLSKYTVPELKETLKNVGMNPLGRTKERIIDTFVMYSLTNVNVIKKKKLKTKTKRKRKSKKKIKKPKKKEVSIQDIMDVYSYVEEEPRTYGAIIDTFWRKMKKKHPDLDFEKFEEKILKIIHENIEESSPSEGISPEWRKIIYDPVTGKYYHYIRFSRKLKKKYGLIME